MQTTTRRIAIMRNHTATHLLNLALRQVLGSHVEQKGSLVDDQKTRFDFSHDKPVTPEELRRIEERVNRMIVLDRPVTAVIKPLAKAKELPGVRAIFGEKYPDPVRVVMIGADSPGPTHARRLRRVLRRHAHAANGPDRLLARSCRRKALPRESAASRP